MIGAVGSVTSAAGAALPALFDGLNRDPLNRDLLARLLGLCQPRDPELRPYFDVHDAACYRALSTLFAQPDVPVSWLTPLAAAQIRARYRFARDSAVDAGLIAALADDPLYLSMMTESMNTDV